MSSIVLQSLSKPVPSTQGYIYSDLHLDLTYSYTRNNQLLKKHEIKDVVADFDYGAIKNSIFNIFTTVPGQKILNPQFGLNLMQYVFRQCDIITAGLISREILEGLTQFEPRIKIPEGGIRVQADPEDNSFIITLIITVPQIGIDSFKLVGTLSNSGFFYNN